MADFEVVASKFDADIVIKPPPPPFAISTEFSENFQDQTISFFKSRSGQRRRRGDTWIISVFVILHILAFVVTMLVNDCGSNSHGDCAVKELGRLSFQPFKENPLLGPSASTLEKMGALLQSHLTKHLQTWRLFTFPCLHAGFIHLVINLSCVIFIGIHLEQEFGSSRVGIIYILSALFGTVLAALFVRNEPSVGSSGALTGLLGATLSGLIRNWRIYTDKFVALGVLVIISAINFGLGLLPYVDNFANIGGFIAGSLLGFMLLFSVEHREVAQVKGVDPFKVSFKDSIKLKLKQKLDKPILRSISLLLFGLILAGCLVSVLEGTNINRHCSWCRFINCVPFQRWSCKDVTSSCETMVSDQRLTLTCSDNGKFKIFPFTNITQARINDLCSLICS